MALVWSYVEYFEWFSKEHELESDTNQGQSIWEANVNSQVLETQLDHLSNSPSIPLDKVTVMWAIKST